MRPAMRPKPRENSCLAPPTQRPVRSVRSDDHRPSEPKLRDQPANRGETPRPGAISQASRPSAMKNIHRVALVMDVDRGEEIEDSLHRSGTPRGVTILNRSSTLLTGALMSSAPFSARPSTGSAVAVLDTDAIGKAVSPVTGKRSAISPSRRPRFRAPRRHEPPPRRCPARLAGRVPHSPRVPTRRARRWSWRRRYAPPAQPAMCRRTAAPPDAWRSARSRGLRTHLACISTSDRLLLPHQVAVRCATGRPRKRRRPPARARRSAPRATVPARCDRRGRHPRRGRRTQRRSRGRTRRARSRAWRSRRDLPAKRRGLAACVVRDREVGRHRRPTEPLRRPAGSRTRRPQLWRSDRHWPPWNCAARGAAATGTPCRHPARHPAADRSSIRSSAPRC
jgi:hypothetical protein